jgi:hypothetical protein
MAPMKQGMGAIQQRKKPNGAKPFPPALKSISVICASHGVGGGRGTHLGIWGVGVCLPLPVYVKFVLY